MNVNIMNNMNNMNNMNEIVLLNNINLWMFQLRIIRKDVEFQLASQKSKDKIKVIELTDDNKVESLHIQDYRREIHLFFNDRLN